MCRGQSHRVPKGLKRKLNLSGRPQPEQLKLKSDKSFAFWFGDACSFFLSNPSSCLGRHHDFAQDPIVVVGRVAQATDVDFRAMRQHSAHTQTRAESPFTMIL